MIPLEIPTAYVHSQQITEYKIKTKKSVAFLYTHEKRERRQESHFIHNYL